MKRHQKLSPAARAFVAVVRAAEERLFPELLDPDHPRRLVSARRSWEYRPSHHVRRGLVGPDDVVALSLPGRRLLSVGAHPACLEHLLCSLGVPAEHVVVADVDPALLGCVGAMEKVVFDVFGPWPALGGFDLILFPESLCIALGDRVAQADDGAGGAFSGDVLAGRLLAHVLGNALERLRPGGEVRADGPMSHPNVVRVASAALDAAGHAHELEYDRFFLRVRGSAGPSVCWFG